MRHEAAGILASAISQLPQRHRSVILKFYVQSLTLSEIASREGIPLGTVKSRMFRATHELNTLLSDQKSTLVA